MVLPVRKKAMKAAKPRSEGAFVKVSEADRYSIVIDVGDVQVFDIVQYFQTFGHIKSVWTKDTYCLIIFDPVPDFDAKDVIDYIFEKRNPPAP